MPAHERTLQLFTDLMRRLGYAVEAFSREEMNGPHHMVKLADQIFIARPRSLQPVLERMLEPIAMHAMRERRPLLNDGPPPELLIIAVERLPMNFERLRKMAGAIIGRSLDYQRSDASDDQKPVTPGNWMVISELGGFILNLPLFDVGREQEDSPLITGPRLAAMVISNMRDPLRSDVTQVVIKALLAKSTKASKEILPDRFLDFTSTSSMAKCLGIAESSAYGAMKELCERNWGGVDRKIGPCLHEPKKVAKWWLDQAKDMKQYRIYLRPMLPGKHLPDIDSRVEYISSKKPLSTCSWAINGWSAIALHDHLFITSIAKKPLSIAFRGSIETMMMEWNLSYSDGPHDPRIILVVDLLESQRSPLLGATDIRPRVQVVDLWQAALDVVNDPDRGSEQAIAIMEYLFHYHER